MSNELGNTPADKNYKPSGIVNDLAEGQVKAVQLTDGTYITEKLAKSMTKAEERALEAYPRYIQATHLFGTYDLNMTEREAFRKGYEQAEKDLALTPEDLELLHRLFEEEEDNFSKHDKYFYAEVLTRFKQFKKDGKD